MNEELGLSLPLRLGLTIESERQGNLHGQHAVRIEAQPRRRQSNEGPGQYPGPGQQLQRHRQLPSKQMTMSLLARLKEAGILVVTREPSGRRPQILAFAELVNLGEGRDMIRRRKTRPG